MTTWGQHHINPWSNRKNVEIFSRDVLQLIYFLTDIPNDSKALQGWGIAVSESTFVVYIVVPQTTSTCFIFTSYIKIIFYFQFICKIILSLCFVYVICNAIDLFLYSVFILYFYFVI